MLLARSDRFFETAKVFSKAAVSEERQIPDFLNANTCPEQVVLFMQVLLNAVESRHISPARDVDPFHESFSVRLHDEPQPERE
jgi:hypothetical protein